MVGGIPGIRGFHTEHLFFKNVIYLFKRERERDWHMQVVRKGHREKQTLH